MWRGIFGGREDYEKRLQYLSKEEAVVHARMRRRTQFSRRIVRNIIVLSVVAEAVAVGYAIMMTRDEDLTWQMRAIRVLPMFVLSAISSVVYSAVVNFTRMQKSARVTGSELKERLWKGGYGEIYNFPFKQFDTILDMEKDKLAPEIEEEEEGEIEYVEGEDIEMGDMDDMEDFEGFGDEDDDGDEDDMEERVTKKPKRSDSDSSSKIGRKSRKVITK
ncbi:hypothetical protein ZWY2020_025159 [Hordeum vulgare]|nr:hypothetical protein ZWY2020_025159 [Hordeum vulgare]